MSSATPDMPPSPPRSRGPALRVWSARIGLLFGAVLLMLLLGEAIARLWMPPHTYPVMYVASDDVVLGVEPRPDQTFEFSGLDVAIPTTVISVGSSGFRGPPVPAKAVGAKRILCIGDSMTYGWGVNDDETYCTRLATRLGPEVDAVNLGVPGYNAAQSVHRLERRGLDLGVDLVVFLINGSDTEPPIDHGDPDSKTAWLVDHSALARFVLGRLERLEVQAVDRRASAGAGDGSNASAGPADTAAAALALVRLGHLGLAHRFETLVLDFSDVRQKPEFVDAMDAWAIQYASLGTAFAGRDAELIIAGDGHPNAGGHAVIAELALEVIVRAGLLGRGAPRLRPWTQTEPPNWAWLYDPHLPQQAVVMGAMPREAALESGTMAQFEAGSSIVGADGLDGSAPGHTVQTGSFEIDRTEVTNADYARFVAQGAPAPTDHELVPTVLRWRGGRPPPGGDRLPVTMVTHSEATAYCVSVGKRLPTEFEWETAARGRTGRDYPWGNGRPAEQPPAEPVAVGQSVWDRTPEGVVDLHWNVAEWVSGPFVPYPGGPTFGSRAFGRDIVRVARGRGFDAPGNVLAPSAARFPRPEHHRAIDLGFRCAR